jgi:hypothetical protein
VCRHFPLLWHSRRTVAILWSKHTILNIEVLSHRHRKIDARSVGMSWCRAPLGVMTSFLVVAVLSSWDVTCDGGRICRLSLSVITDWLYVSVSFLFPMARQPYMDLDLLVLSRFHGHTLLRHTTLGRTPLDQGPARRSGVSLTEMRWITLSFTSHQP